MRSFDVLDRPIWNSLTTRQSDVSLGSPRARRMRPGYGLLAAIADSSNESVSELLALIPEQGTLSLFDDGDLTLPAGIPARKLALNQMVADGPTGFELSPAAVPLDESDAEEMFALATLTQPGPYLRNTNRLGRFWGVKEDGKLVAMAGEGLKVDGFVEVSGVCTHPNYRGRGLARMLIGAVAARILADGEVPILHALADNASAIALYEKLGFRFRRSFLLYRIERA